MKKRMVIMVGAMMLLILALGSSKFLQIRAAMAEYARFQPPPEAVTTMVASEEAWPSTLGAIGSVVAVQGVTVSADLPGIVEKISFESGARGPRRRPARPARRQPGACPARRRRVGGASSPG